MKNNKLEKIASPKRLDTSAKAPYSSPVLRVFGSVGVLTKGQAGSGTDSAGKAKIPPGASDRTIKENIVKVGDHPLGIGLYLFDYKPQYRETCGHDRQFGVMADEVETVKPEAVSIHRDGYKQVNYDLLGISRNIH
jgi:hypothetical protein